MNLPTCCIFRHNQICQENGPNDLRGRHCMKNDDEFSLTHYNNVLYLKSEKKIKNKFFFKLQKFQQEKYI